MGVRRILKDKLTAQDRKDITLIRKGRRVALLIGCGYYCVGAGPGVLLSSVEHPRYPLDLPEEVVDSLLLLEE